MHPLLPSLLCVSILQAAELSPAERSIVATVDAEVSRTSQLLETMVNVNSGTKNFAGVRQISKIMQAELELLGFRTRWVPMDAAHRAGHLVAEHNGAAGRKRLLLIAHMDTVFEPASPFQKFVRKAGSVAEGRGTEDTKGGLAVMVSALRALKSAGELDAMPITIVLTGDEENPGEPVSISRLDLVDASRHSDIALEFEPGIRVGGKDFGSTSRRGVLDWVVKTRGIAGHSGQIFSPEMGYGAINELSRVLTAFLQEVPEKFMTFNIGMVMGGSSAKLNEGESGGIVTGKMNIIPGEALAIGEVRPLTDEQAQRAQEKMEAIVRRHLPKTEAEIIFRGLMPPMGPEKNRGLLALLNEVNRDLGLEKMEELDPMKRGGGDISYVAKDLPSLTGLGSIGGGATLPASGSTSSRCRYRPSATRSSCCA